MLVAGSPPGKLHEREVTPPKLSSRNCTPVPEQNSSCEARILTSQSWGSSFTPVISRLEVCQSEFRCATEEVSAASIRVPWPVVNILLQ